LLKVAGYDGLPTTQLEIVSWHGLFFV